MSNARRARLRERVATRAGLVVPGAYDGVSARPVERAGFEAVYMRPARLDTLLPPV